MKKNILISLVFVLLVGCGPSEEQIAIPVAETLSAIPTQTAYPTFTPMNTFTPYPTYTIPATYTPVIKVVTPTYTPSPLYTATITNTPTITATKTNTPNPLTKDKSPGFYLVGTNIAPGVWKSMGTGDGCYWSITTKTGDIIDNFFGMAGGTLYLSTTAFQVQLDPACGMWTYLGQ